MHKQNPENTRCSVTQLFVCFFSAFRRQAWALVSVVGGGNGSCTEDVREHENHDTGGKALARRDFVTVDGVRFSVSAYSEWWNGKLPERVKSQRLNELSAPLTCL